MPFNEGYGFLEQPFVDLPVRLAEDDKPHFVNPSVRVHELPDGAHGDESRALSGKPVGSRADAREGDGPDPMLQCEP
jgi:hypothetical protein